MNAISRVACINFWNLDDVSVESTSPEYGIRAAISISPEPRFRSNESFECDSIREDLSIESDGEIVRESSPPSKRRRLISDIIDEFNTRR